MSGDNVKKCLILVLIGMICLVGCGKMKNDLEKILEENNYIIVDVRTEDEYSELHIKDAINIPYDEIDESIALDKNKTILVYCQSGRRSNIAYNSLKSLGYEVIDLGAFDSIDMDKE